MRRGLFFLAGLAFLVAIAAIIATTGDNGSGGSTAPESGGDGTQLTGVVWEWQEFLGNDDSTVAPDDPSSYTIDFREDGQVVVQADCNRGFGTYEADEGTITIDVAGVTQAFCGEESLSDRYLGDLRDVRTYLIEDGRLFLDLLADAGTMRFEPA